MTVFNELAREVRYRYRRLWFRPDASETRHMVEWARMKRRVRHLYPNATDREVIEFAWAEMRRREELAAAREAIVKFASQMSRFADSARRAMEVYRSIHRAIHPRPQTLWQAVLERRLCRVCHPGWWR